MTLKNKKAFLLSTIFANMTATSQRMEPLLSVRCKTEWLLQLHNQRAKSATKFRNIRPEVCTQLSNLVGINFHDTLLIKHKPISVPKVQDLVLQCHSCQEQNWFLPLHSSMWLYTGQVPAWIAARPLWLLWNMRSIGKRTLQTTKNLSRAGRSPCVV